MNRLLTTSAILLAATLTAGTAAACPMCKDANESVATEETAATDNRPAAYMYSILFMMAVPATVLAGFGVGIYRLSKNTSPHETPSDGSE